MRTFIVARDAVLLPTTHRTRSISMEAPWSVARMRNLPFETPVFAA